MERRVKDAGRATFRLVNEAHPSMARAYDTPRVDVLRVVADHGPIRPRDIGDRLGMPSPSVTRHLHTLKNAGHVTPEADPADTRTHLIALTPAGRAELADLQDTGLPVFRDVVAGWSAEDLATLTRLMSRLADDWSARGPVFKRPDQRAEPRWRSR
jgi:DNA-binding MarR family transcriptional regulator